MEMDDQSDAPPNTEALAITQEVLALVAELDEFKGAWRALGRIAPERLASLRRVATIESVGSSTRIEGASLSNREVERLLLRTGIQSFATRDEQEVAGYAETLANVVANWEAIDLTKNHVFQLHRDLLRHAAKDARHRGAYKTFPNHVEAFDAAGKSLGVIFRTATPFDTPRLMRGLIAWTRDDLDRRETHPLLVIGVFVAVFLEIHPFLDGNGRLSRILTTLLLLRAGYGYVPYGSLESVIEESKEAYYRALRQTQTTIRTDEPDWQPWITYFLRALQRHKRLLESRIERDRQLFGELSGLSLRILEIAREHGRVTVRDAAHATGTSRNTVKDSIKALVAGGHLSRHGSGRGTWYSSG